MAQIVQLRRGTASAWTTANPILPSGQEGYETDTRMRKVGDGVTAWSSLSYDSSSSGAGIPPINFAYGDASPSTIYTATFDFELVDLDLEILNSFDGVSPSIKIGSNTAPELYMSATDNDPTSLAIYSTSPHQLILTGDEVVITIVPGSGTANGNGKIILYPVSTS